MLTGSTFDCRMFRAYVFQVFINNEQNAPYPVQYIY